MAKAPIQAPIEIELSSTDEERLRQWLWSGAFPLTTDTDLRCGCGLEFHNREGGMPGIIVKVVPRA